MEHCLLWSDILETVMLKVAQLVQVIRFEKYDVTSLCLW